MYLTGHILEWFGASKYEFFIWCYMKCSYEKNN